MGAGKTSVGRLLAQRLGKAFFDSDQEIERATGVKIPVIFEIEGEAGFRAREAQMLAELVQRERHRARHRRRRRALRARTASSSRENGTSSTCARRPHDLWQRTRHDRNRPLLRTAEPLARARAALRRARSAVPRSRRHHRRYRQPEPGQPRAQARAPAARVTSAAAATVGQPGARQLTDGRRPCRP